MKWRQFSLRLSLSHSFLTNSHIKLSTFQMSFLSRWKWPVLLLLMVQVTAPIIFYFFYPNVLEQFLERVLPEVTPIKILAWGPPYAGGWIPMPPNARGDAGCPCNFTTDLSQIEDADAVAFIAIVTEGPYSQLPRYDWRRPKPQLRVFLLLESPQRMYGYGYHHLPNNDQFNWTMTYRHDSDIPYLFYGYTGQLTNSNITASQIEALRTHSSPFSPSKLKLYQQHFLNPRKTKLIAWAVSNCGAHSKRSSLVSELKKFVEVDIYGKCGNLTCGKNCKNLIGYYYKFYLAFENSLCYDYVTEKFFNALNTGVVPIVYGGANYTKLAPPGSYIDILDFQSMEQLANYIHYLDRNHVAYLKYFMWREHFGFGHVNGWCELCLKIHQNSVVEMGKRIVDRRYSKIYPNISEWVFSHPNRRNPDGTRESACQLPPKIFQ